MVQTNNLSPAEQEVIQRLTMGSTALQAKAASIVGYTKAHLWVIAVSCLVVGAALGIYLTRHL